MIRGFRKYQVNKSIQPIRTIEKKEFQKISNRPISSSRRSLQQETVVKSYSTKDRGLPQEVIIKTEVVKNTNQGAKYYTSSHRRKAQNLTTEINSPKYRNNKVEIQTIKTSYNTNYYPKVEKDKRKIFKKINFGIYILIFL